MSFTLRSSAVDTSAGVRAHPSYDHPGNVYLIEATRKVRVASGYDTLPAAVKFCKAQGWKFLGSVVVKSESYTIGRKAHKAALAAKRAEVASS